MENKKEKGKTSTFTKSDLRLFLVCFVIVLIFLFPLSMGGEHQIAWGRGIPVVIAAIASLIPIFMLYAITISEKFKYTQLVHERIREVSERDRSRLLSRVEYFSCADGTVWEMRNQNGFDWTDTQILISRVGHQGIVQEYHKIGPLGSGKLITFMSNLKEEKDGGRWQIFITCEEGKIADFPRKKPGESNQEVVQRLERESV